MEVTVLASTKTTPFENEFLKENKFICLILYGSNDAEG